MSEQLLNELYDRYSKCENREESIALAKKIIELNPHDYGVKLELIFIETKDEDLINYIPDVEQIKKDNIEYLMSVDKEFNQNYPKNKIDFEKYIQLYKVIYNLALLYLKKKDYSNAEKEISWILNNDIKDHLEMKNLLAGVYFSTDNLEKLNQLIKAYRKSSLIIDFYDYYINDLKQGNYKKFYADLFNRNPYLTFVLYGLTENEDFSKYDLSKYQIGCMDEALISFDNILSTLDQEHADILLKDITSSHGFYIEPSDYFNEIELLIMMILGGLADISGVTTSKKADYIALFSTGVKSDDFKKYNIPDSARLFSEQEIKDGFSRINKFGIFVEEKGNITLTRQGHYFCRCITTMIAKNPENK